MNTETAAFRFSSFFENPFVSRVKPPKSDVHLVAADAFSAATIRNMALAHYLPASGGLGY